MDLEQIQAQAVPVEVLTATFQIGGKLSPVGGFGMFLNDTMRTTFSIMDAQVTPLPPGWRAGGFSQAELIIPKESVQVMLVGDLDVSSLNLLPKKEKLAMYTDTFVVSGNVHMGQDERYEGVFHGSGGPFFGVTDAEVYSVRQVKTEIAGAAPIVFVQRNHIDIYHRR